MKTQTRHPLEISYTLMVSDEVIDNIKSSDGTRYWVLGEYEVDTVKDDTRITNPDNHEVFVYSTETALRGIALWIQNGGNWDELKDCGTDHYDHDAIWQYGFFGELVYG
jgi:hypothetical protein